MKRSLFNYLNKGIFSISLVLTLSIISFAQFGFDGDKNNVAALSANKSKNSASAKILVKDKEDASPSSEKNNTTNTNVLSAVALERKAFDLLNHERVSNNLKPVQWNEQVAKIARIHSENMASYDFFSHKGLDGLWVNDRADQQGIKWSAISENIAYNRGHDDPAEYAVKRWMESSSHRQNALKDRWQESGIGVAISDDGKTFYFTQVFLKD